MDVVFTDADSPAAEGRRRVDDRCLVLRVVDTLLHSAGPR
jgi:hypothetical protein